MLVHEQKKKNEIDQNSHEKESFQNFAADNNTVISEFFFFANHE